MERVKVAFGWRGGRRRVWTSPRGSTDGSIGFQMWLPLEKKKHNEDGGGGNLKDSFWCHVAVYEIAVTIEALCERVKLNLTDEGRKKNFCWKKDNGRNQVAANECRGGIQINKKHNSLMRKRSRWRLQRASIYPGIILLAVLWLLRAASWQALSTWLLLRSTLGGANRRRSKGRQSPNLIRSWTVFASSAKS